MTKKEQSEQEKNEAHETLLQWIKPGDTIYTILEHVSRSGMSRQIRLVVPWKNDDGSIRFFHPNYSAAKLLGCRQATRGKGDGLIVGGCGMDMGFHLVYNLSLALFGAGFGCIGKGCPSNDHSNGDRDYTPHATACECKNCIICGGERTICSACLMCSRCGDHVPGCAGCIGHPDAAEGFNHYHKDGGYALRHEWL